MPCLGGIGYTDVTTDGYVGGGGRLHEGGQCLLLALNTTSLSTPPCAHSGWMVYQRQSLHLKKMSFVSAEHFC